jgi:hypothetical protein
VCQQQTCCFAFPREGPHADLQQNPAWRSCVLSGAAVTMPGHAVIATSLPAGLNTGSLAQGISAKSREVTTLPMPDPTGCPGAQVPASAHPGREEPPDAPRFRHARRLDLFGAEPSFSLGSTHLPAYSEASSPRSRLPSAAARRAVRFPSTHRRYSSQQSACFPLAISPQGVRRAPQLRQQVILCTWPLSFGNLASASWQ